MRFRCDVTDNGLPIAMTLRNVRRNMKTFGLPKHLDGDKNTHISVFWTHAIVTIQAGDGVLQFYITPRVNLDKVGTSYLLGAGLMELLRDVQKQVKQLAKGVKGKDLAVFLKEHNLH